MTAVIYLVELLISFTMVSQAKVEVWFGLSGACGFGFVVVSCFVWFCAAWFGTWTRQGGERQASGRLPLPGLSKGGPG